MRCWQAIAIWRRQYWLRWTNELIWHKVRKAVVQPRSMRLITQKVPGSIPSYFNSRVSDVRRRALSLRPGKSTTILGQPCFPSWTSGLLQGSGLSCAHCFLALTEASQTRCTWEPESPAALAQASFLLQASSRGGSKQTEGQGKSCQGALLAIIPSCRIHLLVPPATTNYFQLLKCRSLKQRWAHYGPTEKLG